MESTMVGNLTATTNQYHYQLLNISLMSLLALFITIGNVLSLTIFLGSRRFCTPQGYLKVSLAVADLAVGVIVVPYSVYNEIGALMTSFGHTLIEGSNSTSVEELEVLAGGGEKVVDRKGFQPCFITGPVFAGCTLVSISTIFLLSLERGITVLRPLQKNVIVTKERTLSLITLTWLLCLFMAVCPLLSAQGITLEYSACSKMCNYAPCPAQQRHQPNLDLRDSQCLSDSQDIRPHTRLSSVMLLFPIFDFTMLGSTILINAVTFSAVRRFCRERMQETAPVSTSFCHTTGPSFSDIRAAKTIIVLTALFCISFVPVAVLVTADVLGVHWCHFSLYAFWILASSSGWNVCVYSVRDRRFRQRTWELVWGRHVVSELQGRSRRRRTGRMRPACRRWWRYHQHHHPLHAPGLDLCVEGGCVERLGGMLRPELSHALPSCQTHVTHQQELTFSTLVPERSFVLGSPQERRYTAHSAGSTQAN